MNLLPMINSNLELEDGCYVKLLPFCSKHYTSEKCINFYKGLFDSNSKGFFTCPYGLSCYKPEFSNDVIFTGFKEKSTYNKKLAKNINASIDKEFSPVFGANQIQDLISAVLSLQKEREEIEEQKRAISGISHEVKKLNSQVKERADNILQVYNWDDDNARLTKTEFKNLKEDIRTIFVSSSMIISRFNLYDYEKNPEGLHRGRPFTCNIYKKFDKIKKIFENYEKKDITITIKGNSYENIQAYPSFELIPLLIIENAVKYSNIKSEVEISFSDYKDHNVDVEIESYSPYCSKEDIDKIFIKGFRGPYAKKVSSDGSGIGLYFVKLLCDLHGIRITAKSDSSRRANINGIPYAPFIVKLEFINTSS